MYSASLSTSSSLSIFAFLLVRSIRSCCQLGSPEADSAMVFGEIRCSLEINNCE